MSLTPEQKLAALAMEVVTAGSRKRLAAARRGTVNSYELRVPWYKIVELADELDRQYPGALDRTYDLLEESSTNV